MTKKAIHSDFEKSFVHSNPKPSSEKPTSRPTTISITPTQNNKNGQTNSSPTVSKPKK